MNAAVNIKACRNNKQPKDFFRKLHYRDLSDSSRGDCFSLFFEGTVDSLLVSKPISSF